MKTLLTFTLIFVFATPNQAQTRRATRAAANRGAAATREPASGQSTRVQLKQSLPIRRVILYSNGVAYIERRGLVDGHAEISLSFKQSQVDDVLKSMIVLDLGKGRIGAVSYNSSAPPSARMADIPFSIAPGVRRAACRAVAARSKTVAALYERHSRL